MRTGWLLLGAALVVGGVFSLVPLAAAPLSPPPALGAGLPPPVLGSDAAAAHPAPASRFVTAPNLLSSVPHGPRRGGPVPVSAGRGGPDSGGARRNGIVLDGLAWAGSTSYSPGNIGPASDGAPRTALVRYGPPVPGAVLRAFNVGPNPWSPGHRGVDLAASAGQEVTAAGAGVVAFAGRVAGKPVVSIDHADGVRTTYEPVEASVTAGQNVGAGQVIGFLAAGHRAAIDGGDGLHWGARIGRRYIDPLRLLFPPIVLKPVR